MEWEALKDAAAEAGKLFHCRIVLMKEDGQVLCATDPAAEKLALRQLKTGEGLHRIRNGQQPLCHVWLDPFCQPALQYMEAALGMQHAMHSAFERDLLRERMYLVNQIINASIDRKHCRHLAKMLLCKWDATRCAIIIHPRPGGEMQLDEQLSDEIAGHLEPDDLFTTLSQQKCVVLKRVSGDKARQESEICQFAANIQASMEGRGRLLFACGSALSSLTEMEQSYAEASFVADNASILDDSERDVLFFHDHYADYLLSLVPPRQLSDRYTHWKEKLGPVLSETLTAISRCNGNLSAAARVLGIHHNTMMQRTQKIQQRLETDNLKSIQMRTQMRQFALVNNRKITLNAAIVVQPDNALYHACANLSETIRQKSRGMVTLNTQSLSDSGDNLFLLHTLQSAAIDFAVLDTSILDGFTSGTSAILDIPFLFDSTRQALHIANTLLLPHIDYALGNSGITCLGIWSMGWRYITSRTPIRLPADLAGQKIRIMKNRTLDRYFRKMGAEPIQMNYRDVFDALAVNLIDAQENPYPNILNMHFYTWQKYVSEFNFNFDTVGLLTSKQKWMSLPVEVKLLIQEAVAEETAALASSLDDSAARSRKLLEEQHRMQILRLTPEEEAEWKKVAAVLRNEYPNRNLLDMVLRSAADPA